MASMNLPVIILLCVSVVLGQNMSTSVESSTVFLNTTTETIPVTYEYIVKLVFGLENEKVPQFLLDAIFDLSYNITTADIISLYNLENLNLTDTIEVLLKLNYNPDLTLSIDGLQRYLADFKVTFKDFYNGVLINNLNVSGSPLRKFIIDLGINTGEFTDAITFGEADPLEIFKKGNFSETILSNALQGIGKTTDDLFLACKEEILSNTRSLTRKELFNILKQHNFDKVEATNLWKILELDMENVENVTVFSDLLDQLKFNLENTTYLGILTSNKVAINKEVYANIIEKMQFSKIFAESLYDTTIVELKEEKPYYENIITLHLEYDNFTKFVEVATTTKNLEDCEIVTINNETLVSQHVEKVNNLKFTLEVNKEELNITDLVLGSPLICDNKVYGLARKSPDDKIVFDTFLVHSASMKIILNPLVFLFSIVIYLKL